MKVSGKRASTKKGGLESNRAATTHDRQVITHKGYTIIAGLLMGKAVAQIYLGERRAAKERFQDESIEAVIIQAQDWIDETLEASSQLRRAPQIATEGEYENFFTSFPANRFQKAMLQAHAQREELTAEDLAKAAGYKTTKKALQSYGLLGQAIADALVLTLPDGDAGAAPAGVSVLAEHSVEGEAETWRIHPELASVVRSWEA